MPTQSSLFDFHGKPIVRTPVGVQRRDIGMAAAEAHAPEGWAAVAERAVLDTARRLGEFTSDDVWETGLHPNAVRARRGELVERGQVLPVDRKGVSAAREQLRLFEADGQGVG